MYDGLRRPTRPKVIDFGVARAMGWQLTPAPDGSRLISGSDDLTVGI
jgi:hypothetical protein